MIAENSLNSTSDLKIIQKADSPFNEKLVDNSLLSSNRELEFPFLK